MTLSPPRVFYSLETRFVIGPLGYWRIGDNVEIKDQLCRVCAIDDDGAAEAVPMTRLKQRADEEGIPLSQAPERFRTLRSGYPLNFASPRQQEQIKAIIAAGQARRLRDERRELPPRVDAWRGRPSSDFAGAWE